MIGAGSGNNASNLRVILMRGAYSICMISPSYWAMSPFPIETTRILPGWLEISAKGSHEGPRMAELTTCHLGMTNKTANSFSRD
jgi:hypothetical protein